MGDQCGLARQRDRCIGINGIASTDADRQTLAVEGQGECLDPTPSWLSESLDTIFVSGYYLSYKAHQPPGPNTWRGVNFATQTRF